MSEAHWQMHKEVAFEIKKLERLMKRECLTKMVNTLTRLKQKSQRVSK